MRTRRTANAFLAAAAALVLTASAEQGAAQTHGGSLVVGVEQDVSGFDNFKVLSFAHFRQYILQAIYERMFEVNGDTREINPVHALSATPSDDAKTWRVVLRQGVKFSNGEDLNADAYVTHFTRLLTGLDGRFAGRYRRLMGPHLEGVEKVDDYTVDFKFAVANPGFKDMAAQPNMSWWVTAPGHLAENQDKPEFNENPVGAGPYMLDEWRDGAYVKLVKNPHYWNPDGQYLDELTFLFIPPEVNRVNALKAGDIDVMYVNSRGFLPELDADPNITVISGPRLSAGQMIGFNHSKAPFSDIRVRRALIHALDRQQVTCAWTGICRDKAENDMYGEGHPWHCPDVAWPEHDPAKAKALLDEYTAETGEAVSFNVDHFPNAQAEKTVTAMIDMWRQVGISATQKAGPRGPGFIRPLLSGEFDIFTFVENFSNADPSLVATRFHSGHPSSVQFHLDNPRIDAAVEAVNAATDRDARYAASCAYQQVLADEAAFIPYDHPRMHIAFRDNVGGVQQPFGYTFNAHRLWVAE